MRLTVTSIPSPRPDQGPRLVGYLRWFTPALAQLINYTMVEAGDEPEALIRCGRALAKDFENLAENPGAFIALASIQLALRRLARA